MTESICLSTVFGATGSTPENVCEFWLVNAVMTLKQFASSADAALMFDWIPAPDDGSEPPMAKMFTTLLESILSNSVLKKNGQYVVKPSASIRYCLNLDVT
jgi:hypothetical protein